MEQFTSRIFLLINTFKFDSSLFELEKVEHGLVLISATE